MSKGKEAISRYIWVLKEETIEKEQITAGGIITSAAKTTVVQEAGVVAFVGAMVDDQIKRIISVGDTVLFESNHKGKVIEGVEYLLVTDNQVLMRL